MPMSQYPAYANAYYPPPVNPRPTSVTVLAIIGIVWAALLLLCNSIALIPMFVELGVPDPVVAGIKADPVAYGWSVASVVARVVLAIALLTGSIGALMLKPVGRAAMLFYAWAIIAISLADVVMSVLVLFPIMRNALGGNPQLASVVMGQQIGAIVGILVAMAYPILVLVFMSKPHVKAAFAGTAAGAPAGAYYMPPPGAGFAGAYAPPPPQPPYGQP